MGERDWKLDRVFRQIAIRRVYAPDRFWERDASHATIVTAAPSRSCANTPSVSAQQYTAFAPSA